MPIFHIASLSGFDEIRNTYFVVWIQLVSDSARIYGTLAIGTNSMYLNGGLTGNTGTTFDQITSSYGIINFGGHYGGFWNIRLGVGTQTPQSKMHLWDRGLVDVFTTYTHGTANAANTNGFQVGIAANNDAVLRQRLNNNIVFSTNNTDNMWLTNTGRLGIGTSSPITKHNVHDINDVGVYSSYTNLNANNGLFVGINNIGNAELRQRQDLPLSLFTNDRERIRVTNNASNEARVGISRDPGNPVVMPASMLHIGENLPNGVGAGSRNWMNIGTFYYGSTDNMYVGLRRYDFDRVDAIINWGDNSSAVQNEGPDNLRFVFTSNLGTGDPLSGSVDGAEIARMTYNNAVGRMGIGETNPRAKMHITSGVNGIPPLMGENPFIQLRLSRMGNVQQGLANCDFETYPTGHTVIRPHSVFDPNDPTQTVGRNIGIGENFTNAIQPQRKLHVVENNNNAQLRVSTLRNRYF